MVNRRTIVTELEKGSYITIAVNGKGTYNAYLRRGSMNKTPLVAVEAASPGDAYDELVMRTNLSLSEGRKL